MNVVFGGKGFAGDGIGNLLGLLNGLGLAAREGRLRSGVAYDFVTTGLLPILILPLDCWFLVN